METVQQVLAATVLVERHGEVQGHGVTTVGSGFFIHTNGYLLTSSAVVEHDTRPGSQPLDSGELRVVVRPGTDQQETIPATLVATQERDGMALLKVDAQAPAFLEPRQRVVIDIIDEVFLVSHPAGEPHLETATVAAAGRYPEPTYRVGKVMALRRDEARHLVAIETDIEINETSVGGPLLTASGELLGVVRSQADSRECAVPAPRALWSFYLQQSCRVEFTPTYVPVPRSPVAVTVEPGVLPLTDGNGVVRVEGRNILPVEAALSLQDGLWRGALQVPVAPDEVPEKTSYIVTLSFTDSEGADLVRRSFRLMLARAPTQPAVKPEATTVLAATGSDAEPAVKTQEPLVVPDEQDAPDPLGQRTISEPATHLAADTVDRPLHDDLVSYGKQFYHQERYQEAIDVLEWVLRRDPGNQSATRYLTLARHALDQAAGSVSPTPAPARTVAPPAAPGPTSIPAPVSEPAPTSPAEPTPTPTPVPSLPPLVLPTPTPTPSLTGPPAEIMVVFDPPFRKGTIRLWVDDRLIPPVEFSFRKGAIERLQRAVAVLAGRHVIRVELESARHGVLGTASFTETLKPASSWTLRINLASPEHQPKLFLVERR